MKKVRRKWITINILKKCTPHIRSILKIIILIILAGISIGCITSYFYKPTYSVSLNGEFLGYTRDKSNLQERINEAIQKGNGGTVAFVQIDNMPTYQLCLLKKNIETNDEEIYNAVVEQGTTYYRYYAVLEDDEEKYYIDDFEEAESVIDQLKEKESTNADEISIVETYNTTEPEYTDAETCVDALYKEKVVVPVSSGTVVAAKSMNTSSNVVPLGISLIKPLNGGVITSRYGPRSSNNHKGIDIGASYGTSIYAAAAGTVTVSSYGYNGGYGNYIIISHGNGVETLYGHCSSLVVSAGTKVSQGQLIARVGSTGRSSGNHLHLEIRVNGVTQNPQNYLY